MIFFLCLNVVFENQNFIYMYINWRNVYFQVDLDLVEDIRLIELDDLQRSEYIVFIMLFESFFDDGNNLLFQYRQNEIFKELFGYRLDSLFQFLL